MSRPRLFDTSSEDPQNKRPQRRHKKVTALVGAALFSVLMCYFYAETALHRYVSASYTMTKDVPIELPIQSCELPSCDIVRRSRLYSERCGSNEAGWPLLVTATPRSATVYITYLLQSHGMKLADDWLSHRRDGRVSWIHAFDDPDNYGPPYTHTNKTFQHVLHQLRDPLKGITSMCTEPVELLSTKFLNKHINITAFDDNIHTSFTVLQWWVEWHTFLVDLKLPSYQIERVQAQDIFRIAGLEHLYNATQANNKTHSNTRFHRQTFTWQDLFTIDPQYAVKAWKLAHLFGYEYPNVDFDSLTCKSRLPLCGKDKFGEGLLQITGNESAICPVGTHPVPKIGNIRASPMDNGWTSWGCVEHKRNDGTFVGLSGKKGGKREEGMLTDNVIDQLVRQGMQQ